MADSIQPFTRGISFAASGPVIGDNAASAQAFADVVDQTHTADVVAASSPASPPDEATSDVSLAFPELIPVDSKPEVATLPLRPLADKVAPSDRSGILNANLAKDAEKAGRQGWVPDCEPAKGIEEAGDVAATFPTDVPFQFYALIQSLPGQPSVSAPEAVPEHALKEVSVPAPNKTSVPAAESLVKVSDVALIASQTPQTPINGSADQGPDPDWKSAPLSVLTGADAPLQLARVPDMDAHQRSQGLLPEAFAKGTVPAAMPLASPATALLGPANAQMGQAQTTLPTDQIPSARMDTLLPADRSFLAPLFASVPHLAPRMIQLPNGTKVIAGDAGRAVASDTAATTAPTVAALPTAALTLAPQVTPQPGAAPVAAPIDQDEIRLSPLDGGFFLPTDGKIQLHTPGAMAFADRGLPQGSLPVPVSGLPQVIANIARSDSPQTVGLQLDPTELGTVAFNMETGPAGLVVTIVAERPETLDLLRRHADQFLADLRQSGFSGASLQFSQSGHGQGQGQFGQGHNGQPQAHGQTGSEYTSVPFRFETPSNMARPNQAGGLNLRL